MRAFTPEVLKCFYLLAPGKGLTFQANKLICRVPLDKHTRLVIQVVDDGYAVETKYSEWFDTWPANFDFYIPHFLRLPIDIDLFFYMMWMGVLICDAVVSAVVVGVSDY